VTEEEEKRERARFERAIAFAWVLWHEGLTAASIFRLLGELLRRGESRRGAAFTVQVSDFGVTVLPGRQDGQA